jgi:excisionase family DNA binding protein
VSAVSIPEQLENFNRALTAPELAQRLNLHRLTIYRLAQSGKIPHFRIGSSLRFDGRAVASYLREHEVRG